LKRVISENVSYSLIHFRGGDIELALTHRESSSQEEYLSFVNGQYTPLREARTKAYFARSPCENDSREFFKKNYEAADIRKGIIAAISIKVIDPIFES